MSKIKFEKSSKVSSALIVGLSPIILFAMWYFEKVYSQNNVFTIEGDMRHKTIIIFISLVVLIISSLHNSATNAIFIKSIKKLNEKNEIKDKEINELISDLSSTINIFFKTYLRKEKSRDESINEIKNIMRKNGLEVKEND